MKSTPFRYIFPILVLFTVISIRAYADVTVYADGKYTQNVLVAKIYTDIVLTDPILSYGIKLKYNGLSSDPTDIIVMKNDAAWYFGTSASHYPTLKATPDTSTPGEVTIIGGKLDQNDPLAGVIGTKVLLATVSFVRTSQTVPSLSLHLGKDGNFSNFVQISGNLLDSSLLKPDDTIGDVTLEEVPSATDFSASVTNGIAPLTVNFTDQSIRIITSWSWTFGDGQTSTEQNPTHIYTSQGNYTVSLQTTGPDGSDTETKVNYISVIADADRDGLPDDLENQPSSCTSPTDSDTDDDGITDGNEDINHNGSVDTGETDPCNSDTDQDGIQDGTELGYTLALISIDTNPDIFIQDADPTTVTDPTNPDSDEDGINDGDEDLNHDGKVDAGETDPFDGNSYPPVEINLKKGFNLIAIPEDVSTQPDLKDWIPSIGDLSQIQKVMVYDPVAKKYITLIPEGSESYTLQGGEGLIVSANQDRTITFDSKHCVTMNLKPGLNLVGFACSPYHYSAFNKLQALGNSTVYSIQRFNTEMGAFETAGFDETGNIVGVNFWIVPGEGYFIYYKQ